MNIIAQEAHFRQRVVKYSNKKGVTEASRRYHVSRQAIYDMSGGQGMTAHGKV